jgi:hypothetical protein
MLKPQYAVHILLAISFTFISIWGLYPLNAGAISLIFIVSNCLSILIIYLFLKLFKKPPRKTKKSATKK